jgi:hypothetical protein
MLAGSLSSCCEPATKDSRPVFVDSLFSRTPVWEFDRIASSNNEPGTTPDSGYYPVYTFGIRNAGSQDDQFTLRIRSQYTLTDGTPIGFDITRMVPAQTTVLFRTPTAVPDSITSHERITYAHLVDTLPHMSLAYIGFFTSTPDSTMVQFENPQISVFYGAIDDGPEGCSTPATSKQVSLPPYYSR